MSPEKSTKVTRPGLGLMNVTGVLDPAAVVCKERLTVVPEGGPDTVVPAAMPAPTIDWPLTIPVAEDTVIEEAPELNVAVVLAAAALVDEMTTANFCGCAAGPTGLMALTTGR